MNNEDSKRRSKSQSPTTAPEHDVKKRSKHRSKSPDVARENKPDATSAESQPEASQPMERSRRSKSKTPDDKMELVGEIDSMPDPNDNETKRKTRGYSFNHDEILTSDARDSSGNDDNHPPKRDSVKINGVKDDDVKDGGHESGTYDACKGSLFKAASEHSQISQFGWWKWRPQCLQFLRNEKGILFFMCMASAIQGMVVNGFVNVVISSIERRFDLSSTDSGQIASCYDIASVLCLIPISYFGGLGHKPRYLFLGVLVMGIGSLVFALPHFLTDPYTIGYTSEGMCNLTSQSFSSDIEDVCDADDAKVSALSMYKYFFYAGQLLHGAGASPLYTIGVTYLDENLSRHRSPLYIGIFYTMSIVGPAIGYLMGGKFIDIYTDYGTVNTEGLTTTNPKWVGAWWIGFLISMSLAFFTAFPISGFPIELDDRKENATNVGSEVFALKNQPSKQVLATDHATVRHILLSAKVLLLNPTFMFLNFAAATEGLLLSGFSTFTPKFIESQFFLSSGDAAFFLGLAVIPAGGGGTFLGGYIYKRFDLHIRGALRMCVVCSSCSIIFLMVFLVQCKVLPFAGVNTAYPDVVTNYDDEKNSVTDASKISPRQVRQPNTKQ